MTMGRNMLIIADIFFFSIKTMSVCSSQEPALYESNFTMAIVYVVLMVTALVIGTAGNLLILVASACLKSLRKTGYIFIVNLAAADLCVAGIADPMCVVGKDRKD